MRAEVALLIDQVNPNRFQTVGLSVFEPPDVKFAPRTSHCLVFVAGTATQLVILPPQIP